MSDLQGKTVIVRGIGDATSPGVVIARAFARTGANVVLAGASSSKLKAAAMLVEEEGVECVRLQVRHDDVDDVPRLVEGVNERFGRIDVLVNAVLVARPQLLSETKPRDLEKAFRVCAEVPFAWMRACLPHLAKRQGTVISLGSRLAQEAMPGLGALAAATQGFQALNAIAAREWANLDVSANIVQAAARNAHLAKWESELDDPAALSSSALEVEALPDSFEGLARTCLHLTSEDGHHVTGQTLVV